MFTVCRPLVCVIAYQAADVGRAGYLAVVVDFVLVLCVCLVASAGYSAGVFAYEAADVLAAASYDAVNAVDERRFLYFAVVDSDESADVASTCDFFIVSEFGVRYRAVVYADYAAGASLPVFISRHRAFIGECRVGYIAVVYAEEAAVAAIIAIAADVAFNSAGVGEVGVFYRAVVLVEDAASAAIGRGYVALVGDYQASFFTYQ